MSTWQGQSEGGGDGGGLLLRRLPASKSQWATWPPAGLLAEASDWARRQLPTPSAPSALLCPDLSLLCAICPATGTRRTTGPVTVFTGWHLRSAQCIPGPVGGTLPACARSAREEGWVGGCGRVERARSPYLTVPTAWPWDRQSRAAKSSGFPEASPKNDFRHDIPIFKVVMKSKLLKSCYVSVLVSTVAPCPEVMPTRHLGIGLRERGPSADVVS